MGLACVFQPAGTGSAKMRSTCCAMSKADSVHSAPPLQTTADECGAACGGAAGMHWWLKCISSGGRCGRTFTMLIQQVVPAGGASSSGHSRAGRAGRAGRVRWPAGWLPAKLTGCARWC